MRELAYKIVTACKSDYLKRFGISLAIVAASLVPAATLFHVGASAFMFNWTWIEVFPRTFVLEDRHPELFGLITIVILALAAVRFITSFLATIWFALNALGASLFIAIICR